MGTYNAFRESTSAREFILLMASYLATPCPRDQTSVGYSSSAGTQSQF